METVLIILRYLNFILSLLGIICMLRIVYRTEKELDKVFKLLLTAVIFVFIASLIGLDYTFKIIPGEWARFSLLASRAIALFLFLMAGCKMLKIIKEESCK